LDSVLGNCRWGYLMLLQWSIGFETILVASISLCFLLFFLMLCYPVEPRLF
jgi:hypothetical protein